MKELYTKLSYSLQASIDTFSHLVSLVTLSGFQGPRMGEHLHTNSTDNSFPHGRITNLIARSPDNIATLSLELPTVTNHNLGTGSSTLASDSFDCLYHIHSVRDLSEDYVLIVQPTCFGGTQEELRSICIRTSVCHAQDSCFQIEGASESFSSDETRVFVNHVF